jgi:hypothetical protein
MKKTIVLLLISLLSITSCFSQDILTNYYRLSNDQIQQISASGISSILALQDLNYGLNNKAIELQNGNENSVVVKQTADPTAALPNQSYNYQLGNHNSLSLDQTGGGNILLSFQFGYLTEESFRRSVTAYGLNLNPLYGEGKKIKPDKKLYNLGSGEGNKIEVSQDGSNNGILAVQEGDDNLISAGQKGINNYLLVIQKGNENSVTGYNQENTTEQNLYDSIIQQGDNLSITTDGVARNTPIENIFCQTGTNLSIDVHNEFLNSSKGLEVVQKGRDMKIVIDQSYFPNPLR